MGAMSVRALPVLLAGLALGACAAPAAQPDRDIDPGFRAVQSGERLAPLARFLGDWEGTSENLRGNFTVARRLSWLVPDSWLLEQSRVIDPDSGEELFRTALLYSWDAATGSLRSETLQPGGTSDVAWLAIDAAAGQRTLHAVPGGPAIGAFRTLRFTGGVWSAAVFVPDETMPDGWREVERLDFKRRAP